MDDPEKRFQCRPGELMLTRGTRAVKIFKYSPHVPSFAFWRISVPAGLETAKPPCSCRFESCLAQEANGRAPC